MRVATAVDAPALAALRASWGASLGGGTVDGPGADDLSARLRRWGWSGSRGARTAGPAVEGERPVGMVNVAVFERMPHAGRPDAHWAYLANLWAAAGPAPPGDRRGTAVGGGPLVTGSGDGAGALNPSEMSLPLYRSLGFRPADDLLRLDLEASAACSRSAEVSPGRA